MRSFLGEGFAVSSTSRFSRGETLSLGDKGVKMIKI